jgi:hypothetical protein
MARSAGGFIDTQPTAVVLLLLSTSLLLCDRFSNMRNARGGLVSIDTPDAGPLFGRDDE